LATISYTQKHTFNLQASWDKINRFEESLRANRSSALYPNLFAAKFRDEWELKKRARERVKVRAREWEEGSVEDIKSGDGKDERNHQDS